MRTALIIVLAVLAVGAGAPGQTPAGDQKPPDQNGTAAVATAVLTRLDRAWNAGDGDAFAAEFTVDTDVININGTHFRGRPALAKQMRSIFETVFKGSTHRSRNLELARHLDDDVILAVSSAEIDVPAGPLAPQARSRQTLVLVRAGDGWQIRHWHNTPIRPERPSTVR